MDAPKTKIRQIRSAYFTSGISITLVLLIAGFTMLIIFNAKQFTDYAKDNIGFTIFLKESAKPADTERLYKTLQIAPYTNAVEFVNKEEAAKELQKELGEDFQLFLGYNPLPNSIEVKLKANYATEDSIKNIRKSIEKKSFVKEFFYRKSLVEQVSKNIRIFGFIGTFFALLLLLIAATLISNSVRLSVHSKRFHIKTAQLVGGDDKFIRKPFVINSIVSGIFSTAIAALALVLSVLFLQGNLGKIISMQGIWLIILIMLIFGVGITGTAGYLSVNRYLTAQSEDLYTR